LQSRPALRHAADEPVAIERRPSVPELSGFDPLTLPESNATSYPEPYRAANQQRWNRRLGDHAKLTSYGVNLTRIVPGGQSSHRHAHSRQDEFIYVVQGEVELETNAGVEVLHPGMCAGFPAGTDNAHRFVNRSGEGRSSTRYRRPHRRRRSELSGYRHAWPHGARRQVCFHPQRRHSLLNVPQLVSTPRLPHGRAPTRASNAPHVPCPSQRP
jgi:uncharacterized cupin superfamily protein